MGGDSVSGREARMHDGGAAPVGAASRTRPGTTAWAHDRRAPAVEGAPTRSARIEAGERDSAEGVGVFCPGGARPPRQVMIGFISEHRARYGVEPICAVLPIAP